MNDYSTIEAPQELAPAQEPTTHELKTDPAAFHAVYCGHKTFEIRFNDRGFRVGDMLLLLETRHTGEEMRAGAKLRYTGRRLEKTISHIQDGYGLQPGWVCLSFAPRHDGITLTGHQLQAALEFTAPDRAQDTEQLETEVRIEWMPARMSVDGEPMAAGDYMYFIDYPDEGVILLDPQPAEVPDADAAQRQQPTAIEVLPDGASDSEGGEPV